MRRLLAIVLLSIAATAAAENRMEILPLKHRPVDQVLPVLRPLLEPGGALTGTADRLIVRTSPRNLEELKAALAAIDVPLRRLMITVKHDSDIGVESAGAGISGSAGAGGARVTVPDGGGTTGAAAEARRGDDAARARVWSTRGRAEERVSQQVQTVEGARAFIQVGQSFPLPLRQVVVGPRGAIVSESVVYRDLGTGFYAVPTLMGERVTVEIVPQQESLSTTVAGAVHSSRLSTTVSGNLGEWMVLGGASGGEEQRRGGIASYSTRGTLESRRVMLRVDPLP